MRDMLEFDPLCLQPLIKILFKAPIRASGDTTKLLGAAALKIYFI